MGNSLGPEIASALARVPEGMPAFQVFLKYLQQVKQAAGINREEQKFDNVFPPGFLAALNIASGMTHFYDREDDDRTAGLDGTGSAYDVKQLEKYVADATKEGIFDPIALFTSMGGKLKT